jgi:protein required for attachment to host cells
MSRDRDIALVADAQRARFLQRVAPAGAWLELVGDAVEIENPRTHERGTDRPGRSFESAGAARQAVEPRSDAHRAAKAAFAQRLAERLEAQAKDYAGLILVAPPGFLGDLRAALGEAARSRLIGTLDKDLTRLPTGEIVPHLTELRPA